MKNGVAARKHSEKELSANDGTLFITNGTAGGNPTGPGGREIPTIAFTPDRTMYSFAIMDIDRGAITYRVFDVDNNLIDHFVLER